MKTISPPITVTVSAAAPPPQQTAGLPSWVPPPGYFGNIPFTNTADSVMPAFTTASSADPVFTFWNGAIYVPEYSTFGAMAYHGAGHGTVLDGVFLADLTSLTWRFVNGSTQLWSETNFDQYGMRPDGSVFAPHMYQGCQRMPVAWGGRGGGSRGDGQGLKVCPHRW